MPKSCCFIGHRKVACTNELIEKIDACLKSLVEKEDVRCFLFGDIGQFDTLCYERVTNLQALYPDIKRIRLRCKSEYACQKEEKEELERITRAVTGWDISYKDYKDYESVQISERVLQAGRASYVERNEEMINASDFCVFYYNVDYLPPSQSKSGTKIAFTYASKRKRSGANIRIINLYEENK